jgi:hypothetical protein
LTRLARLPTVDRMPIEKRAAGEAAEHLPQSLSLA